MLACSKYHWITNATSGGPSAAAAFHRQLARARPLDSDATARFSDAIVMRHLRVSLESRLQTSSGPFDQRRRDLLSLLRVPLRHETIGLRRQRVAIERGRDVGNGLLCADAVARRVERRRHDGDAEL